MTEPLRIELRGEAVDLTEDEARAVLQSLHRQFYARSEAEEAAAREAGQVWIATYWRHFSREEEECFSLKEAADYLDHGDAYGEMSSESIRCPGGTVYTREDRGLDDWANLPALKVAT